jgi:hypothetical protein
MLAHLVPLAPRDTRELEFISLKTPVEILNSASGGKVFSVHRKRLQEILDPSGDDTSRQSDWGLILPPPEKPSKRPMIDYPGLAHSYRQKMRPVRS